MNVMNRVNTLLRSTTITYKAQQCVLQEKDMCHNWREEEEQFDEGTTEID